MAKKMNLNVAKEFLFNHGEKVALGTCVALALLIAVMGFMDALGAGKSPDTGKPWADELKVQHDRILASLNSAEVPKFPEDAKKMLDPSLYDWKKVSTDYQPQPYINIPEDRNDKRQNPRALAIRTGPKGNQLQFKQALVHTYETYTSKAEVKILDAQQAGGNDVQFGPKKGAGGMAAPGGAGGGAGGQTKFYRAGDPRRMIIGYAVFPLKDQVAEFQRALKYTSQKEMFDAPREDLPTFLGFNLLKVELLPNGQPAKKEPEVLLMWDPAAKNLFVAPNLKKFLSVAMYDEKSPAALEPFIFAGLTMPLPQLAFGSYDRVSLEGGIESGEMGDGTDDAKTPMKKGGTGPAKSILPGGAKNAPGKGGPGMPDKEGSKSDVAYNVSGMNRTELKAIDPALDARLFGSDFNIYHVLGQKPAAAGEEAPKANQPAMPKGPGGAGQADRYFTAWDIKTGEVGANGKLPDGPASPSPMGPPKGFGPKMPSSGSGPKAGPGNVPGAGPAPADPASAFPNWERDAVVRFIDIDVEPGKTYRYAIQIRLKNPNFERNNRGDVAYANLTQIPELVSEWVYTEPKTILHDYFLYAMDQNMLDDKKTPLSELKQMKDATTFQIHQWTQKPVDQDARIGYPIGDWAIAVRVLVPKGSPIGPGALANVPFWKSQLDSFDLPKKIPGQTEPGIKIDMAPPVPNNGGGGIVGDTEFPVLIDFVGGKRKIAPTSPADEEVAVDALIVGRDGKLRVLNSRDATDNTPYGREREERLERVRKRVAEISGSNAPKKAGPAGGAGGSN